MNKCRLKKKGSKYCVFEADIDKKKYRMGISADWKEDVNIVDTFWRFRWVNVDWEVEVEIKKRKCILWRRCVHSEYEMQIIKKRKCRLYRLGSGRGNRDYETEEMIPKKIS